MSFATWQNFGGGTDKEQAAAGLLSPLDNPDQAFNTALQQQGYNIYKNNPFVASLQRSSRGLRQSYIEDRALNANPYDANSQSSAQDYNSYLRGTLANPSGVTGALKAGYANVKPALQQVRSYQDALGNGGVAADKSNPYLQLLSDEMSSGNGQGTATALTNLQAPLMGAQLGRAYNSMLGDVTNSAFTNLATDPGTYAPGSKRDIWSYIFGTQGSPF